MSLERYLTAIEAKLDEVLPRPEERPAVLHEAMRHAVGSGGKRLRPVLCLAAAEAVGGKVEDAICPACAIELLHNYTLVHDDLPAMDNDVLRRGQPTVWKKFGEANAILVGDSLQALAFAAAAKAPRKVPEIVATLGRYGLGVVQGQVEDVGNEELRMKNEELRNVDFVYEHKTGDLFCAAAVMGAYAGGGDDVSVEKLRAFALNLGLAFQFEDDLLDGDSPYPESETMALVEKHTAAAIAALDGLPGDTKFLRDLASRLVNRKT